MAAGKHFFKKCLFKFNHLKFRKQIKFKRNEYERSKFHEALKSTLSRIKLKAVSKINKNTSLVCEKHYVF